MKLDLSSAQSIDEFANQLIGLSLSDFVDDEIDLNLLNKGDLGNLVERYFFKIKPDNNNGKPDFPEAGVELKTTGVKRLKNGELKPKERLVLTKINFNSVVNETWETSSFLKKCALMLILFYLYDSKTPVIERTFIAKKLWRIPDFDLPRIKADWEIIVNKIRTGNAHQLSEGDTWYLGACTKSSNSAIVTTQPYSTAPAKPRAFSFKIRYLKSILDDSLGGNYVIPANELEDIEKILERRVDKYRNLDLDQLANLLDLKISGKAAKANLALRLLGFNKRKIPELEKANIQIKIITINQSGTSAKEAMSFPAFDYMDFRDSNWEESDMFSMIEKRFLFMVFKIEKNRTVFKGLRFWTMPYDDRLEVENIWNITKERILSGNIDNLPAIKDTRVAHVRPHGKNADDIQIAPDGKFYPKKSFWLNAKYIYTQVEDLM